MYCRHLSLANFRNYLQLSLDLSPKLTLFWGDNGQGKSNLLEAVYLLATTRSYRTAAEREMVNWQADTEPAFARVAADVVRHHATNRLEIVLAEPATASTPRASGPPANGPLAGQPPLSVRRRVRINGHHKPPVEMIGQLNVVLFSPEDVTLIAGPAEVRRRYLDITLCQIDHHYLRTLRLYVRVLQQRNALLREQRERPTAPGQFEYWDQQLVSYGAELLVARLRAVTFLNQHLSSIHPRLASAESQVRLAYRSTVPLDGALEAVREDAAAAEHVLGIARQRFEAQLGTLHVREQQQGVTLLGPHRDDVGFFDGDVDLRTYGSRGQQRTAALSLKLAEVALMERYTAERPVLLLDDVMSELDPKRRQFLQAVVLEQEQVLLTATELSFFGADFLQHAQRFRVHSGALLPEE